MNPERFLTDLRSKPSWLDRLAARLADGNPFAAVPADVDRVLFLGMGSSRYAANLAALDLRTAGIDAAAEYASLDGGYPPGPRTLVVAVSATGESAETLDALERYRGRSPIVGLTNARASSLAVRSDVVVDIGAGDEAGGVACRSFQHTGLLLRCLEGHLTGIHEDVADLTRRVRVATAHLLSAGSSWLPAVLAALDSPDGVHLLAPVERLASAEQGALMIREGPRRRATASETGDWVHVDLYLAKTLDYRALLFTGSRWDGQALEWLGRRDATIVAVGGEVSGAVATIRYPGDDDPDVARYTEVLVPELVAAAWWQPAV